jgi:hypothetical protein
MTSTGDASGEPRPGARAGDVLAQARRGAQGRPGHAPGHLHGSAGVAPRAVPVTVPAEVSLTEDDTSPNLRVARSRLAWHGHLWTAAGGPEGGGAAWLHRHSARGGAARRPGGDLGSAPAASQRERSCSVAAWTSAPWWAKRARRAISDR